MKNRVLVVLISLFTIIGLIGSLVFMFEDLGSDISASEKMRYGAYFYFIFLSVAGVLFLFARDTSAKVVRFFNIYISIFFLFTLILVLISFFASPTESVEIISGAIFYASYFSLLSFYIFANIGTKNIDTIQELTIAHKVSRYFIYSILVIVAAGSVVLLLI